MLAVFTSELGGSFINRHTDDLMPGQTVVVTRYNVLKSAHVWKNACPLFSLESFALGLPARLARRAGLSETKLREAAVGRFLRRHKVTVVLGEFLDQFLEFVPLLDRMGLPYVVQGHGTDVSTALRQPGMGERYLAYKSARMILTRSEFHRRRLINLGLPAEKIAVNAGGVDILPSPPQRAPDAAKRFLAVSYMVAKKGPIYLLEAFRIAAAKDPAITLDVVGGGPMLEAMRQFADVTGLEGRVRFHGNASEETKERLLLECGIFVQHSITDPETGNEEGLPASIQEAMAHGLAVVSTRHAGIAEAVEDGVSGYLVGEKDARGMAEAMLQAIPSASRMGEAAYARATAEFSWADEKSRLLRYLCDDTAG